MEEDLYHRETHTLLTPISEENIIESRSKAIKNSWHTLIEDLISNYTAQHALKLYMNSWTAYSSTGTSY